MAKTFCKVLCISKLKLKLKLKLKQINHYICVYVCARALSVALASVERRRKSVSSAVWIILVYRLYLINTMPSTIRLFAASASAGQEEESKC